MFILDSILDAGRVILTLVGLTSPYPEVVVSEPVLRVSPEGAFMEFRASSLVNRQLRELAASGYTLVIRADCSVKTAGMEKARLNIIHSVCLQGETWRIDPDGLFADFDTMTNALSVFRIPVLTTAEIRPGVEVEIRTELGVSCADIPNAIELWGNRPKISARFRL